MKRAGKIAASGVILLMAACAHQQSSKILITNHESGACYVLLRAIPNPPLGLKYDADIISGDSFDVMPSESYSLVSEYGIPISHNPNVIGAYAKVAIKKNNIGAAIFSGYPIESNLRKEKVLLIFKKGDDWYAAESSSDVAVIPFGGLKLVGNVANSIDVLRKFSVHNKAIVVMEDKNKTD